MVCLPVQLFVDRITPPSADREAVFLHGILGSGQNLRTVARRFTESCPGWGAALVDLRGHGRSMAMDDRPATLETVASDVIETLSGAALPTRAIIGHSFGGKIALELARAKSPEGRALPVIDHVVVIDSLPGARPDHRGSESIAAVLAAVEGSPGPFESRNAFTAAMEAAGLSKPIAQWLATSVKREDDGTFRFGIDLTYVRAVLNAYFLTDCWDVLTEPRAGTQPHLLIGGRSSVFGAEDRARAEALERRGILTIDVLDTGHWVHAEAPEAVVSVLARRLSLAPKNEGT